MDREPARFIYKTNTLTSTQKDYEHLQGRKQLYVSTKYLKEFEFDIMIKVGEGYGVVEAKNFKDLDQPEEAEVPRIASMVACLLTHRADSDSILGDLDEKYRKHRERYGARFARFWYWWQVTSLVGPRLRNMLIWLGGLAGLKRALDCIGKLGGP